MTGYQDGDGVTLFPWARRNKGTPGADAWLSLEKLLWMLRRSKLFGRQRWYPIDPEWAAKTEGAQREYATAVGNVVFFCEQIVEARRAIRKLERDEYSGQTDAICTLGALLNEVLHRFTYAEEKTRAGNYAGAVKHIQRIVRGARRIFYLRLRLAQCWVESGTVDAVPLASVAAALWLGVPGRPVTTDDVADFAIRRRNQSPAMPWKEIAAEWKQAHPERAMNASAIRAAVRRHANAGE